MTQVNSSKTKQDNHPAFRIDSNRVSPDAVALKLRITPAQAARFLKDQNLTSASWAQVRAKLEFGLNIPLVYSVREVAAMADVSPSIVSQWISSGRLESIPLLTPRRVPAPAVARLLAAALRGRPVNPKEANACD